MKRIAIAVDIEKAGCKFKYPIISIGFVVGHKEEIFEKKRFNIKVNWESEIKGGDFEDKCITEFWSKQSPNIINECKENALSPEETYKLINEWLNNLENKFPSNEYKICFLTDNASFDIASIDYELEKYLNRSPLRYSSEGKYRGVYSADDMIKVLPSCNISKIYELIDKKVKHDHNPVNDAYFIYLEYYYALLYSNHQEIWEN
jgi:hypothetical protein